MKFQSVEVAQNETKPSQRLIQLEEYVPYALAGIIVYLVIRCVMEAKARPFWFDELCTWAVVRQGSPKAIWNALWQSVDGQPPFYYVIVRFATWFVKTPEISYRIPSIVGLCGTILVVYLYLKKSVNTTVGFLGALIPIFTPLYHHYAVEARPYTLVVGFIAAAVLCYQHAPSTNSMIAMGVCLALAQAVHYYAFLMFVPLVLAEAVYLAVAKEFRRTVWVAFSVGYVPLLACWPLLSRFKAYYGGHFGSHQTIVETIADYGWFVRTHEASWAFGVLGLTIVMLLYGLVVADETARYSGHFDAGPTANLVLAAGFVFLPILMFAATEVVHGGFAARYALASILGFPIALGMFARFKSSTVFTLGILALALVALISFSFKEKSYYSYVAEAKLTNPADAVKRLADAAGHFDLPLVISHSDDFIQLSYYASPAFKSRFVWNADAPSAIAYKGFDTSDLELMALKNVIPLQAQPFDEFIKDHSEFLLYSSGMDLNGDWWPRRFREDGYFLQSLAKRGEAQIYVVRRPNAGP